MIFTTVDGGKMGSISAMAAFTASAVSMMFSPGPLHDVQRHHRVPVQPGEGLPLGEPELHRGHVPDVDRPPLLRGDDQVFDEGRDPRTPRRSGPGT